MSTYDSQLERNCQDLVENVKMYWKRQGQPFCQCLTLYSIRFDRKMSKYSPLFPGIV